MGCIFGTGKKQRKKAPPMSDKMREKVEEFFRALDENNDKKVTKQEAKTFWKSKNTKFPMISAKGMFQETDTDNNEELSEEEWLNFWQQVLDHGYSEDEIISEITEMIKGDVWRDWLDSRAPGETKPEMTSFVVLTCFARMQPADVVWFTS